LSENPAAESAVTRIPGHARLNRAIETKGDAMKKCVLMLFLCAGWAGPLWAEPTLEGELIFPLQDKHVHGSSVVECSNGDLLAAWYHGSGERKADDVLIQGARLKKGEKAWSTVFLMTDTPGFPDCNPVLFIDGTNKLWLFWVVVQAHRWEHSLLKYRTATDYAHDGPPKWAWQDVICLNPGAQFAEAVKQGFKELYLDESLWAEYAPKYSKMIIEAAADPFKGHKGWMTRIHPIQLPTGRMLLPLYSDGFNFSLVGLSDDGGETWRTSLPIVGLGPIQPALARKQDGTLLAYMRDGGGPPNRVLVSSSKDNGETWSVARDTDIPNPGSSLEVIALKDGRWAMAYNDVEDGRNSLSLALSDDEGQTWKYKRNLERAQPGLGSFAYPSLIQARDGRLHLTYSYSAGEQESIKHVYLDSEWITQDR
jgi:predicted neuraminidase